MVLLWKNVMESYYLDLSRNMASRVSGKVAHNKYLTEDILLLNIPTELLEEAPSCLVLLMTIHISSCME